MFKKPTQFLCLLAVCFSGRLSAQYCPPNIDFETGTTASWNFYVGTCCPIATPTMTSALPGRHVLTSGSGTDPYGLFPIVSPGGGSYSLKLGNDTANSGAERARYYVHVPSTGTYSLIYRYAVVMQDPGHAPADQPRMEINAFDSITNITLSCAQYTYLYPGISPGFSTSTVGSMVKYKPWTRGNIKFNGYAGRTVAVDFATGDCGLTGHFAYGYVDMSCGIFADEISTCPVGTVTLTGPAGDTSYQWYDSATFTTSYGTTASVTIPAPTASTTYALIVTPYSGFGCIDTLYTRVTVLPPSSCPSLGIDPLKGSNGLTVFPNPNNGNFTVLLSALHDDQAVVTVMNMVGEKVEEFNITANRNNELKLSQPPGVYILSVVAKDGRRYMEKVTLIR